MTDTQKDFVERAMKSKVVEWGYRILLLLLVAIIGSLVAAWTAASEARQENFRDSINRRLLSLEASVSDVPILRERVAILESNRDTIAPVIRDLQRSTQDLAVAVSGLTSTVDSLGVKP
jgi:sensor histidine kinase regulating citrate/malate metabolism